MPIALPFPVSTLSTRARVRRARPLLLAATAAVLLGACSSVKYGALEKVGIHKRDVLVDNVEDARESQEDAREEFKDALERFGSVVSIEETGLKKAYDQLNDEYEDAAEAAEEVSDRIDDVERVAEDLFDEWEDENRLYTDASLRRDSEARLKETQSRYADMLTSMKLAEQSMQPVLNTFLDNVLYLKHNLNAQAVGSLRGTFTTLEGDIDRLISQMNRSIERSNQFIQDMRRS